MQAHIRSVSSELASGDRIKALACNTKGRGREQQRFRGGKKMCKSSPLPGDNMGVNDVKLRFTVMKYHLNKNKN